MTRAARGSTTTETAASPIHNVGAWTTRRAAIAGDRVALVDAERSLDYAAFHARTTRCVAVLARAGIGPGERVALLLGNRSAYLEIVMAAARLGAIAVPINARFTAPEVRHILEDCSPRMLVHDDPRAEVACEACQSTTCPPETLLRCPDDYERDLAAAQPDERIAAVAPDHPMILMYTSGTTGVPKGALLPHCSTPSA
jgi:fatty-acyl-CoA synthase